jgi:alkaline phosphatase
MRPRFRLLQSVLVTVSLAALTGCVSHALPPQGPVPASGALHAGAPSGEESGAAWFTAGLQAARERGAGEVDARNLILFVGDGMGPSTVTAARILQGQRGGARGEETELPFERFSALALAKTYNTDAQTPDSAGTMTAMVSGAKTRMGVVGLDQRVARGHCGDVETARLPSLLTFAHSADMATGLVTTTRITHATPAAVYAASPERDWEADSLVPAAAKAAGCRDIAEQLRQSLLRGELDVVLGGGRQMFVDASLSPTGKRGDGRNLLAELAAELPTMHQPDTREALLALPPDGRRVLGLFADDHLDFEHDRRAQALPQPSLADMTRAALQRLQATGQPYVLVVEGGRIDHAHHHGWAALALDETLAFADAVAAADAMTRDDDTLIVVTADHSHTLSFAGYPARGNPILGLVRSSNGRLRRDLQGRPYTTLGYANGPGAATRQEGLEQLDTGDARFRAPARVPLEDETHGGEDVAVYARGPGSTAVRGVIEQHVVFHLLALSQPALRPLIEARAKALARPAVDR